MLENNGLGETAKEGSWALQNWAPHSGAWPLGSTHLCVQITDELAGAGVPHSVATREAVQDYVNKLLHAGGCTEIYMRQLR